MSSNSNFATFAAKMKQSQEFKQQALNFAHLVLQQNNFIETGER